MNSAHRSPITKLAALPALALVLLGALAGPLFAQGIEYRSAGTATVLRDAPSPQGRALFMLRPGTPVEIVVAQDGWLRVRESGGTLSWVERSALSTRRTVMITAERATIRRTPREDAPPSFEAVRNVVLELLGPPALGWAQVRHADGLEGFVRAAEVWGL